MQRGDSLGETNSLQHHQIRRWKAANKEIERSTL